MPLSKKKRFEVFKRDKFTCCYCGRRPPEVTLQVDHVLPRCEGGGDEMENLTTSCSDCNLGKGGRLLDDVAPVLDELEVLAAIQETCERRMALQASLAATQEAENTENLAIDSVVDWWNEYCPCSMLERDIPSVRHFVRSLEMDRIRESILLAARIRGNHNSRFKYFCACCWNMIRGEAESA